MPKNYDFGVRGVNWNEYKEDYLLRTDAIWEKIQMKDVFYSFYKVLVTDVVVKNVAQMMMYDP